MPLNSLRSEFAPLEDLSAEDIDFHVASDAFSSLNHRCNFMHLLPFRPTFSK